MTERGYATGTERSGWRAALTLLAGEAGTATGWAVSGSCALVLHGASGLVPRDVDVVADASVVREFASRFGFAVSTDDRSRPDLRVEVRAAGSVDGVPVELLAGVRNRLPDGQWSPAEGAGQPVIRSLDGVVVPVVGLGRLRGLAELRGDRDRLALVDGLVARASPLSLCTAVLVDLDGTLVDHVGAASAAALVLGHRLGHADPASLLPRWFELEERHMRAYLAGEVSFAEQRRARLREFAALAGAPVPEGRLDEAFAGYLADYEAGWAAYPDVAPALRALRHLRLGALTNGDPGQQRRKLAATGLLELVDEVVTSHELGAAKPAPAAFTGAARRLGVEPYRTAYVGDRLDSDAEAATAAGLHGVWLDRGGAVGRAAGPPVVRDLRELVTLLLGRGYL